LTVASCATAPQAPLRAVPLLNTQENAVLQNWLSQHPAHRIATEADCACAKDIRQMRVSGSWGEPFAGYEPFVLRADFNKDGNADFAVLVVGQRTNDITLMIFNGPFSKTSKEPAYSERLDLQGLGGVGLFLTQKEHWPLIGPFESEGCVYEPAGATYKEDCGEG
jgi:hypothetical protein